MDRGLFPLANPIQSKPQFNSINISSIQFHPSLYFEKLSRFYQGIIDEWVMVFMDSQKVTQEYPRDLDRSEAYWIVKRIRDGCGLSMLHVGIGAYLEPPRLDDYINEGFKILIDIYRQEGVDIYGVEDFIEEMGLGYKYVKRIGNTYLMVYKPRVNKKDD